MNKTFDKINLISGKESIQIEKKELKNTYVQPLKRNYGIDLLKIISMINIINLHINKLSGLLYITPKNPKFKQVFRLQAFSFWPVNAFGLISGIMTFRK